MQEQATTGPLIFTTEDRYGRVSIFGGYLFLGLLSAVVAAVPLWSWEGRIPYRTSGVIVMFLFGLIFFIAMVVGIFLQRGTWRFDEEGIAWHPLHRKPRYIRWEDVNRILWTDKTALISSDKVVISIPWHPWRRRVRLAAREFVMEKLGNEFDLEDYGRKWRYRMDATFGEQNPSDIESGSDC